MSRLEVPSEAQDSSHGQCVFGSTCHCDNFERLYVSWHHSATRCQSSCTRLYAVYSSHSSSLQVAREGEGKAAFAAMYQ
ncbi:hypothetical protein GUITHDRAFT_154655 [Guillardia theta CCMP2712]|uniref:Uncharacterized protein n=1 Tax=Guillardia theta (strain CCMP2712) TaxID=905079 RepID=L1IS11_GUITC|nr:hypothetical protein GUITHDRAFT_154655 [Guillardia theta CCMP2712]EKX38689.1 hypothetical protein GUITHDRAFT_154655 [Guillardia theta CCMP2712]|eukprot:XP_005825669.1 hypothetical protein GUITHDRAFT_154655 [Guillardia theta CCMP2712]